MTKLERRNKPCRICSKPEYAHPGGRFCSIEPATTDSDLNNQLPDEETLLGILRAVAIVFGRGGCGCVKDLPGDNYTCSSHQTLREYARKMNGTN